MAKGQRTKVQKFTITLTVPEYEALGALSQMERRPIAGIARIRITKAVAEGVQPQFRVLPRYVQTRKITVALPDVVAKEMRAGLTYPASMAATLRAYILAGLSPWPDKQGTELKIAASQLSPQTVQISVNRESLLLHTRFLIASIEPALGYDPIRQHNQEPPELWSGDKEYLAELRRLVDELKALNAVLSALHPNQTTTERSVIDLRAHLKVFLYKYAETLGKAAGYATVGLISVLLLQLGLKPEFVKELVSAIKLPE